jgi:ribosome biogenesis protein MAK21
MPKPAAKPRSKGTVLFDDTDDTPWHARPGGKEQGTPSNAQVAALRASAERLFGDEVRNWTSKREARASGDDRYMSQVLRSGTMADKVAAMTLMVQESPIHRLETLDSLLSTAKAGKHTAKMAIDSLKEVFSSRSGLPGDRRLVTLESRPPLPQSSSCQVLWLFEEKLKQRYASFVNVVQGYLKHSASELRRFAAETCAHLLKSKPEQEAELLALLVNKLGDPDPSVSARASQLLSEVLKAHRAMTGVVVEEIQGFTAKAPKGSVGAKARLAAVACLSQVYLSAELEPVATSLVKMYLALFVASVDAGDLQTKLLAALLTGVARALPYARKGVLDASTSKELDALFGLAHAGTGPARVRALQLLERLSSEAPVLRSRFERALYAALHAPETRTPSKPALLLNVVFRACKGGDASALLKRCVQVALHNSPQVACASTYLASNIFEKRPELGRSLIAGRASEDDWRLLLKRDPAHASPGKLWELHTLRTHYHPSCRAWAEKLASSKTISYGGDPLVDFGLMRFLDRFAYRNPKQRTKQHGHARTTAIDDRVPVKALTGKHLDSVAPEDRFFLRSFKSVSKKDAASSSDDDDDDVRADALDFTTDDLMEDDSDSDDSPIVGLPIYDSDGSEGGPSDSSDGSEDSGSAGSEPDDFPFSEDDDDAAAAAPPPPQEKKKRKGASPFADAGAYDLDEDGDVEAPVPGELPKKKKKRRTASK